MAVNTISIVASEHPVSSVMVLKSSKAEVSRKIGVFLKTGRNKVTISKLPTTVDDQTVRISLLNLDGTPSENTHLSDAVCSTADNPGNDPTTKTLRALEIKKSGLQSEKKMLDTQAEVMVTYARSLTDQWTSTKDMDAFLDAFCDRGRKNIEATMKLEAQIAEVDKQIKEEKRKKERVKGSVNTELGVVVVADGDTRIKLDLTYVVSNAKWSPAYELHVVTGEEGKPSRKVSLHYHASIKQATGEDWTDTALTLSTVVTDAIVKTIPTLEPVKISVPGTGPITIVASPDRRSRSPECRRHHRSPTPMYYPGRLRSRSPSYVQAPWAPDLTVIDRAPSPVVLRTPPQPVIITSPGYSPNYPGSSSFMVPPNFQASQAAPPGDAVLLLSYEEDFDDSGNARRRERDVPAKLVTQTPMTLTYTVRGRSDIPSDGKDHTVTIAILTFEADIEYISVPRVDPRVFLQCKFKNKSEYRLLPGPVSVILDNNYVSRTNFSDVNRNGMFTFTLGDDPSIAISYERVSTVTKEGTRTFAEPIDITTYTTTITTHNTHPFPIENLAIRDAVPISGSDNRIKVLIRKPQELVEAKEGEFVEVGEDKHSVGGDEKLRVKWEKEQDGLYEYRWKVGADDTVKFETVFEVKGPSDLKYNFSNFDIHRNA